MAANRDEYGAAAEFYDLMALPTWRTLGMQLRQPLVNVISKPDSALVDLGAGSGLSTRELAAAIPAAPVTAVEPSASMRAVLYSRVADSPDLQDRVTVWPTTAQQFSWPSSVLAVTAMRMIGHLQPDDRRRMLRTVADRLDSDGIFLIHLQDPATPTRIARTKFADLHLGEHRYEGWMEARPTGKESMRWLMRYRALRQERLLAEAEAKFEWWTIGPDKLLREADRAGFTLREESSGLFALRRFR